MVVKRVILQALTMKYECFTCLLTYITTLILYDWDTSIDFTLWQLNNTHEFPYITTNLLRYTGEHRVKMFERMMVEIKENISFFILARNILPHHDLAARH